MTLRDVLRRHARGPLTRLDHFGELVDFKQAGATTWQIGVHAVVDRKGRQVHELGDRRLELLTALLWVPADAAAVAGIPSPQNGARFRFAMDLGGAIVETRWQRTLEVDEGGYQLEVVA